MVRSPTVTWTVCVPKLKAMGTRTSALKLPSGPVTAPGPAARPPILICVTGVDAGRLLPVIVTILPGAALEGFKTIDGGPDVAGVAVGAGTGVDVGCGAAVGAGTGVDVGCGAAVAVASGAAVGAGAGAAVGAAIAAGAWTGVTVAAGVAAASGWGAGVSAGIAVGAAVGSGAGVSTARACAGGSSGAAGVGAAQAARVKMTARLHSAIFARAGSRPRQPATLTATFTFISCPTRSG